MSEQETIKVKCPICNKEFDAKLNNETSCGQHVTTENHVPQATVNTVCPDCINNKESSQK